MDLTAILEVNRVALAKLDEQGASLASREEKARLALDRCADERREIEREHEALVLAEQVYKRLLNGDSGDLQKSDGDGSKLRARIGPKRYMILAALRENNDTPIFVSEVAKRTGLPEKRVKDQLTSDQSISVVAYNDGFTLTSVGLDLLSRFEAYKDARGEALPPLWVSESDVDLSDEQEEDA